MPLDCIFEPQVWLGRPHEGRDPKIIASYRCESRIHGRKYLDYRGIVQISKSYSELAGSAAGQTRKHSPQLVWLSRPHP